MKTASGCLHMPRWGRLVMLGIVLIVGLLACDIMVHISRGSEGGDSKETPKERRRRSADPSTTATSVEVHNETPIPSGAVFTRWGRSDCPPSAALVYKGVIASGHAGHKGGGAEYLCMTDEPEWLGTFGTINKWSILYGVEYKNNILGVNVNENGVCAVCQSRRRNKLMIPGRISCPDSWSREYHGYLMSSDYREEAGCNFICVDLHPEADRAGFQGDGGGTLYNVHAACGSLPCPKYVGGGVVTCVMCTR